MQKNYISTKMAMGLEFFEQHICLELLLIIWLLFLWEFYLNMRQRMLMKKLAQMPDLLNGIMTQDLYIKARSYSLDTNGFCNVDDFCSTIFNSVLLITSAYYYCYNYSEKIAQACGFNKQNEIIVSAFCLFFMSIVMTIVNLPFKIYHTFILEEKHGFNKQKPLFFAKDQLMKFGVTQLLLIPFMCGVIWIVQNGGNYFFIYLWIFTVIITIFMLIIYPEVIAPLFDKYSPLPEGELKKQIEALAASINFPLYKLFIVEGSKRSSHSNAYLYGFHKHKRIVLFDTLVKEYYQPSDNDTNKDHGCDTDEVISILAHELGHWKYSHTLKGFILAQINFLLNILPFAQLLNYKAMYVAFGFTDSQPVLIGLIIVTTYFLIPLNTLIRFIMTVITRRFEFQADNFAKILGHAEPLKRALMKLHKDNLGYPIYDKLYSGWNHDHPPLLERLEALEKGD